LTRTFTARDGTVLDWDDKPGIVRHVAAKLKEQGVQCSDRYGGCMYRDPNRPTIACAAGWLIPDDIDVSRKNGASFDALFDANAAVRKHFGEVTKDDIGFVMALQFVHDTAMNWENGSIAFELQNLEETY
jgi:hypothetical protein